MNSPAPTHFAGGEPGRTAVGASVGIEPLPSFTTALSLGEMRRRLDEANRRGKLPEIEWSERAATPKPHRQSASHAAPDAVASFRVALPSRPLLSHLQGVVRESAPESAESERRVEFAIRPSRWRLRLFVALNLAFIVLGPLTTEFFVQIKSWWWQPPIYALTALWIALRWPKRSLADARHLAPHWIERLRQRLDGR